MTLVLTLRDGLPVRLDAGAVRPDALAGLARAELAALPLRAGNRPLPLGEAFAISGDGEDDVRVVGDLRRVDRLGEAMGAGRLTLDGPAGEHVGARMSGGELVVHGAVGPYAGAEMAGGLLHVHGDAGDGLGAAYPGARAGMRGGELLVDGDAGAEAGAGLRRGLIAVAGRVGAAAGLRALAGTIVALGGAGAEAGTGMRRASLAVAGAVDVPATYAFACRLEPPALRLQLRRLHALGLPLAPRLWEGRWARFSGDRLELGRGELLVFDDGGNA